MRTFLALAFSLFTVIIFANGNNCNIKNITKATTSNTITSLGSNKSTMARPKKLTVINIEESNTDKFITTVINKNGETIFYKPMFKCKKIKLGKKISQ